MHTDAAVTNVRVITHHEDWTLTSLRARVLRSRVGRVGGQTEALRSVYQSVVKWRTVLSDGPFH